MKGITANDDLRSRILEHPLAMIIAVVLITMGYSKHKKKLLSKPKLKTIGIFYTIALILVIAKLPWKVWFNL